ncbi:MAG: ABC transporter permease [Roseobacter sp.]
MQNLFNYWNSRFLIWQLTKREVIARYRGSALGLVWSILNPLMMLCVYTFVFSVVFSARWDIDTGESQGAFAVILFAGLALHNFFAECINRAPTLVLSNVSYVKKIVFPLQVLPVASSLAALFHLCVSIALLLVARLVLTGTLGWTVLAFPVLLVPFFAACVGLGLFLASLGVFVRDIAQVTGIFTTIALFVSPVFYPITAVPEDFRIFIWLNPLSYVYEVGRGILVFDVLPEPLPLLVFWVLSFATFLFGSFWFERTKKGFADVM